MNLFQKLFSNRDYVFKRRYRIDKKRNLIYLVNRITEHPSCPVVPSKQRVSEYWSYMIIKPQTTFDKPGIEFSLTYFDNPGLNVPSSLTFWVTVSVIWMDSRLGIACLDSMLVFISTNMTSPTQTQSYRRQFNTRTIEELRYNLQAQDWSQVMLTDNVDAAYKAFHGILQSAMNIACPLKILLFSRASLPAPSVETAGRHGQQKSDVVTDDSCFDVSRSTNITIPKALKEDKRSTHAHSDGISRNLNVYNTLLRDTAYYTA
ncbi:StAR- lipid transfer protein 7, mitochondrial [Homalodisca vitripennis]|nr:StAR- lipid transfer protein 7, mitochondrial [Homalodisca vitripennis]